MSIASKGKEHINLAYKKGKGTTYGRGKVGKNFNRILGNVWCKECFTRKGTFHKIDFEYICTDCRLPS